MVISTASSRRSRKRSKQIHLVEEDHFQRLHDEIIVSHILPLLSTKEAVRTSILSHRWKNLWIHGIGSKLVFSHKVSVFRMVLSNAIIGVRAMFASGINHVLESYPNPTLDQLSVCIDFDTSSSNDVESWIEFALRKGVARLELDLMPTLCYQKQGCSFPHLQKLLALHAFCGSSNLHQPVHCAGLLNLRDLCLKYVNVSSEVIEFILSNCPSLERLCVWASRLRHRVKLCGQSPKLKSLEFVCCVDSKIDISSSNLVTLRYNGASKALRIQHIPFLSHLSIGGRYCRSFLKTGSQNFSFISQLKRLKLDMSYRVASRHPFYPLEFPEFVKLEHLEVKANIYDDSCLPWPIVLIKASPSLRKFSFQVSIMGEDPKNKPKDELRNLLNAMKLIRHQCLRVIEILGFRGSRCELELIQHLFGTCESLEQVSVSFLDAVRAKVDQLSSWLPQGAQLLPVSLGRFEGYIEPNF